MSIAIAYCVVLMVIVVALYAMNHATVSEAGRAPLWPKSHLINLTSVRPLCYDCLNNDEGKIMQNLNGIQDFNQADYEAEEQEQFDFFVDHEAVYDCDPYDVESYHAEAMLAYYD